MVDSLTACLKADEAAVTAILTSAPFNHVYIQTFGDFTDGNLLLLTYPHGAAPGEVGASTDAGDKVVIHTRAP